MADYEVFLTWLANEMTGFSADEYVARALDTLDNVDEWLEDHPEIDKSEIEDVLSRLVMAIQE